MHAAACAGYVMLCSGHWHYTSESPPGLTGLRWERGESGPVSASKTSSNCSSGSSNFSAAGVGHRAEPTCWTLVPAWAAAGEAGCSNDFCAVSAGARLSTLSNDVCFAAPGTHSRANGFSGMLWRQAVANVTAYTKDFYSWKPNDARRRATRRFADFGAQHRLSTKTVSNWQIDANCTWTSQATLHSRPLLQHLPLKRKM